MTPKIKREKKEVKGNKISSPLLFIRKKKQEPNASKQLRLFFFWIKANFDSFFDTKLNLEYIEKLVQRGEKY